MKYKIMILTALIAGAIIAKSHKPCGGQTSIAYGGLMYNLTEIGSQCWMKENLNTGEFIRGRTEMADNKKTEKYCYDDDENNCRLYGGLYQWNEMMNYVKVENTQGICPEGFHIPSDSDFKILEMFLGMTKDNTELTGSRGSAEGSKLLYKGGSGFNTMLSGNRQEDGNFYDENVGSYFWTSTADYDAVEAMARYIIKDNKSVFREMQNSLRGMSVRCLKN
jgi:uncharacterized protein (TIGR02145 family)